MKQGKVRGHHVRAAFLAVVFALCSAAGLAAQQAKPAAYDAAELTIAPGATPRELGFAWITAAKSKAIVQVALKADRKGSAFPVASAKTFSGTSSKVVATAFWGDDATVDVGTWSNKVTVTGLAASTEYVYRVGDGTRWATPSSFATADPSRFGFFVVADPQLGARSTGAKTLESDTTGWQTTVEKATAAMPDAAFMVSLGDQVNDYGKLAAQLDEYRAFFSPAQLRSLPLAAVDGNHDFAMGELYGAHYNQPNLSTTYGVTYGNDGDYSFVYGNVLFLMLNSNDQTANTHDLFIRDAIARNKGVTWRVACFHHSIYSEADHPADPDIVDRRATYTPVLERYGIDVVLQGHDHAYTRTLPMAKGKPVDNADPKAATITSATGIVYFTFDSASGSKYYDWKNQQPETYSAVRWQGKVPSFGYVTADATTFTVTTFRADDMSVIDTFAIQKQK